MSCSLVILTEKLGAMQSPVIRVLEDLSNLQEESASQGRRKVIPDVHVK